MVPAQTDSKAVAIDKLSFLMILKVSCIAFLCFEALSKSIVLGSVCSIHSFLVLLSATLSSDVQRQLPVLYITH